MDNTTQTIPNVHPNYVARMDALQQDLDSTRMDLHLVEQENKRLKESENDLRDHLHDQDNELSRLERALEKAYEHIDNLKHQVCKLQRQELADTRKIVKLQEELLKLLQPTPPAAQAPPAFADEDEDDVFPL